MRTTSAIRLEREEAPFGADAPRTLSVVERPAAGTACDYELITTRAAFDALAVEWNELFARSGRGSQMFQSFNWNWHWCNHYLGAEGKRGPSLAVVIGRRAGRLVMVWPLVTARVAGLIQLASMGEPVSQYSDALIDNVPDATTLLRAAWAYVVAAVRPDLVWLPRVREDAAIAPLMAELGARATQRLEAPYLDLSRVTDLATYMQRHSARSRKKRRAALRRVAELGAVSFVRHSRGTEARDLAVEAIDMKRRQLAARGIVSPALTDPRMRRFFADAADGAEHPSGCLVYALEIGGERAAIDVLFACQDRVATHILAYDDRFGKDSVGVHLLEHAIARSFADGCHTFDLLAPADAYKMRWADGMANVTDWAIPVSAKGAAFTRLYLMLARPLLKSALRSLPGPLRRFLAARYANLMALS